MIESAPKILVVARGVWDDNNGTSSTLTNLFSNYNPDSMAMIYVEAKTPQTKCCHTFFRIPEIAMVKKVFHWRTKVGERVDTRDFVENGDGDVAAEDKTLNYVRGHRSSLFTWLREMLWALGLWKTKGLRQFIEDENPDVLWFDGSTNIFLDRLYLYILRIAKKPAIVYLMDDNYTYKSMTGHRYLYYFLHRRTMRKVIEKSKEVLVISPKMKREFDEIFHINSTIITKGIDYTNISFSESVVGHPVRLLYMGQIIYGRHYTLEEVIKALKEVNRDGFIAKLSIYTNNKLPETLKELSSDREDVEFCPVVPYSEVQSIIANHDVLLFMESLNPKYSNDARLSFSTKITDYLASGKCIFAVGPYDSAPMEYFQEEDCAIVAHDQNEIADGLRKLCDTNQVMSYSRKGFEAGLRNHDKHVMDGRLEIVLNKIVKTQ